MLASLQDTHPNHDGPSIGHWYLLSHGRHVAHTIRDDREHLPVGHATRVFRGKLDGAGKTPLSYDAPTCAGTVMTTTTVDIETLFAARHCGSIDGNRRTRDVPSCALARL
jgi:hypothetical protein